MYLYKHAVLLNHEYIADECVAGKVTSVSDYQNMLIRVCAGNKPMSATSSIGYSLTKKRLQMMFRTRSRLRSWSKTALLLPLLALLTLTFCSRKTVYSDSDLFPNKTFYSVPKLHANPKRSKKLGIPVTDGAQFTSSGVPFTGIKKVYYTRNDSLYMKQYYKDGIETGALMYRDGDSTRQKLDWSLHKPNLKESYTNGVLVYKDILPSESKDGMGHVRMWHKNGQLAFEVSYTGDHVKQGLMTEYDKKGNVIKQVRYKNGKVMEKIK